MPEAVAAVMQMLASGEHHQVVTMNATMLYRAVRDEKFRRLVTSASLVTPDGMGVLLVARILGAPFPEKVSGVDLAARLCEACAEEGVRVFLLGAAPGVAEGAAQNLLARYPGLQIAGVQHGYFDGREEPAVIKAIRTAGALDVYAGRTRLAPEWVRRAGLEWAYRLLREPRRWTVAITLPLVILMALRERAAMLLRGRFRSRGE
ncbi:MAG: WecB/TagA/CpsF family glycosyltransferase [Armatimonadetes bacterium]|nr:WecB/TagA/CpsF family glycosyltransferase [Armatimonadota bacterium]